MNKPHLTLHSCNQALSRSNAALGLGAPHAPTLLSAISARLTTATALSQMGLFLLAGWLSGAVLGYRRALRALWHHTTVNYPGLTTEA